MTAHCLCSESAYCHDGPSHHCDPCACAIMNMLDIWTYMMAALLGQAMQAWTLAKLSLTSTMTAAAAARRQAGDLPVKQLAHKG